MRVVRISHRRSEAFAAAAPEGPPENSTATDCDADSENSNTDKVSAVDPKSTTTNNASAVLLSIQQYLQATITQSFKNLEDNLCDSLRSLKSDINAVNLQTANVDYNKCVHENNELKRDLASAKRPS